MSVRTSLRQQPAEAFHPKQTRFEKQPTRMFPRGPAAGELLTAGAEPRPPAAFKQAAERGAARRQRRAFEPDSRASAGGQVDT